MPYDIQTKDGILLRNIPDSMAPDAPELREIVRQERGRIKYEKLDKESRLTPEQAGAKAAEGMGTLDRARANIGAGMMNAWEGAKQILPGVKGISDSDLREKRVLDKALAKSTETGAGADWLPSAGSALQFLGEVAPTLAIPAGTMTGIGAKYLPRAAQAMISTPGRAAVTGGAAAGALMPTTDDESRLLNTGLGAAGGAVLPAAMAAYKGIAPRMTQAGRQGLREARVGGELIEQIGEAPARQAADLIENYRPTGAAADIPMTTAQRVRMAEGATPSDLSTKLAATELGSRSALADEFSTMQRQQAEGIYGAADKAFGDRGAVDALAASRDAATGPLRETALKSAGRWSEVGRPLNKAVDELMAASVPGSPQRGLATLAKQMLSENPTPEQLYQFRKLLAKKLTGPHMPGDDVAAIVKGADAETMALMKAIDARLDQAAKSKTAGQAPWSDYMNTYVDASKPVTSARAQQKIFETLTPEGGRIVGDTPQITRHVLGKALKAHGSNRFGETLEPAARGRADDLMTTLQRLEEPMATLKLGGTGGGGSQTSMQRDLAARAMPILESATNVPFIGAVARNVMATADDALRKDLAALMINPERAASAIRAKLSQNQPLTRAEGALVQALGSGAGVGATSAMQAR